MKKYDDRGEWAAGRGTTALGLQEQAVIATKSSGWTTSEGGWVKVSHDGMKGSHTFHCIASFCISISNMIIDNYHSTSKAAMSYLFHLSTSNSDVYTRRSHGAWMGRWAH